MRVYLYILITISLVLVFGLIRLLNFVDTKQSKTNINYYTGLIERLAYFNFNGGNTANDVYNAVNLANKTLLSRIETIHISIQNIELEKIQRTLQIEMLIKELGFTSDQLISLTREVEYRRNVLKFNRLDEVNASV